MSYIVEAPQNHGDFHCMAAAKQLKASGLVLGTAIYRQLLPRQCVDTALRKPSKPFERTSNRRAKKAGVALDSSLPTFCPIFTYLFVYLVATRRSGNICGKAAATMKITTVQSYTISTTWFGSFHSQVLSELLNGGFDIRYLNAEKLQFYINERIKQKKEDFMPNPWDYDLWHIIGEISSLNMDWYDIRLRKSVKTLKIPRGRLAGFECR